MTELATRYERHLRGLRVPLGTAYLTSREYQVVSLMAEGDEPKTIAGKLGRSRNTVDALVRNAKDRVGAKTSCHLVAMLVAATYET